MPVASYASLSGAIAEQACYDSLGRDLEIQMLKVGDKVMFHSDRAYQNWIVVNGVTVVLFLTGLIFTVLEIKKRK